jgi:hypothetical protein
MKCPRCKAKLLPVDGEMFCLQCGNAVKARSGARDEGPDLSETTDPLLQKAITESLKRPVHFKLPISEAKPVPATTAFTSMRAVLAAPQPAVAAAGPAAQLSPPIAPPLQRRDETVGWPGTSKVWLAGLAVFGIFLAINMAISGAYAGRVYPGVSVGAIGVGGVREGELESKLQGSAPVPSLAIHVGAAQFDERGAVLGRVNVAKAAREAIAIGHNTPLPIAGLLQSWLSRPVDWSYSVNTDAVNKLAGDLADSLAVAPSVAVPVVYGGQAFVITEKSGVHLDVAKSAAKIASAVGKTSSVSLQPDKLDPLITASSYAGDVQAAQNTLSLSLQLTVKSVAYKLTPQQIGAWLVFRGPGKGISVDAEGVSAFIASIPGSFDRAAASSALIGAVQDRKDLAYTPSVRHITTAPKTVGILSLPLATYTYCVRADKAENEKLLADKAGSTLSGPGGWQLGGHLKFVKATAGCNFTFRLTPALGMNKISQSCNAKASCQSAGLLAINIDSWQTPPKGWSGSAAAYQTELIGHEVGHWLGFEHSPCTTAAPKAVISTPAVVLGGCSPNWYPIESEPTKEWSSL